jgi:hypothetical protein
LDRVDDVIPICHTIVDVLIYFEALVSTWANIFVHVTEEIVLMDLARLDGHTPLLELTSKHLCASNREYDEEEHENEDCIFKHGQC